MAVSRRLMLIVLFVVICAHVAVARTPPDSCEKLLEHIKFLSYKLEKLTNQVHKIPFDLYESKRFFAPWKGKGKGKGDGKGKDGKGDDKDDKDVDEGDGDGGINDTG